MAARAEADAAPQPRRAAAVLAFLEREALLVVLVAGFALVLLARVRSALVTDGWTVLLAGREIVEHGLPSHETLTVWASGREWVDQQWLAQVTFYGLERVGGLGAALLVHVALAAAGLAACAAVARARGASMRSVTWVALLAIVTYFPGASVLRAQSFTYVLFAAVLWLLTTDACAPSRRTFAVLPILALWANLHGSVLVGALLVSLYGVVALASEVAAKRGAAAVRRSTALAVLPWAMVVCSPYAVDLVGYYRRILFESGFSGLVGEWEPTTLTLVTAPFFVLALFGIWSLGRFRDRFAAWEQLAFVVVTLLAFSAVRNLVWFALVALAFLPRAVDAFRKDVPEEPARLNRLLGVAAVAAVVVTAAVTAARPASWFVRDYPPAAADVAAAAAGTNGRVFANERYADWLLWEHPSLAGRVAFDSRFELLRRGQVEAVARFRSRAGDWRRTIRGYRVLVLDPDDERDVRRALVRDGAARPLYRSESVSVLHVP